jgi:hypothetical protein
MLKGKTYRTRFNLYLDVALAAAFLVSLKPFVTGMAFHEWLGLVIGVVLVVHAAVHRQWIVGITKQLFRKLPVKTRVYYALDAALLVAFATIIGSGVMMSTAVLPLLGVQGVVSLTVAQIHSWASYLTLALLGMKLVLHWTWIKNAIRRYVTGIPVAQKPAFQSAALALVPVTSENTAKIISRRRFLLIGCSAVGIALLARVNKDQQVQGDPVATPTGVLSDDIASAAVDTPAVIAEPTAVPTAVPTTAAASQRVATRCPRGLVNDPYPGRCRHYVDKNGNGICDLSETT